MNIVILGAETILGKAFLEAGRAAPDMEPVAMDATGMLLADVNRMVLAIPDANVVVNCISDLEPGAAAPANREHFTAMNLHAAQNIAQACSRRRIKLVHFSSVHVFDGAKQKPYTERDTPNPLNHFGTVKLAADKQVRATGGPYLVVRLPMVYGAGGANWVDDLVADLRVKGSAQAEGSSVFCPTWSRTIAEAVLQMLRQNRTGVMNFSAGGQCTPIEAARTIATVVRPDANVTQVERKTGGEANVCAHALLDTSTYQGWSGREPPHWSADLRAYLASLH